MNFSYSVLIALSLIVSASATEYVLDFSNVTLYPSGPLNQNNINLNVKDSILIIFKENPTTGYTLRQTNQTSKLTSLLTANSATTANGTYVKGSSSPGVVGSGGLHYFWYTAKAAGVANLVFSNGQQWTTNLMYYNVTVSISKSGAKT